MEYKSSNIAYTKANDQETQRVIYIKDTSLIFQLIDYTNMSGVDKSVAYFEGDFNIIYNNGTTYNEPNIDWKLSIREKYRYEISWIFQPK